MTIELIQQVLGFLGSLVGTSTTLAILVFLPPSLQHTTVVAPSMDEGFETGV